MSKIKPFPIRVYYEDTDAGGIVYYANYLKFAERARTEALRGLGLEQTTLVEKHGIIFVVRHCEADYRKPARLDDLLTIETALLDSGRVSLTMQQTVRRNDDILAVVTVKLVIVGPDMRPTGFPDAVRDAMQPLLG